MTEPAPTLSPQRIAEKVRDGMFRNDRASKWLGMQIAEVAPGRAVLTMTVRDEMLNGHDICHGGLITTLADSAFAFACNSYNELTVASVSPSTCWPRGAWATCSPPPVWRCRRQGAPACTTPRCRSRRRPHRDLGGRSYTLTGKPAVAD